MATIYLTMFLLGLIAGCSISMMIILIEIRDILRWIKRNEMINAIREFDKSLDENSLKVIIDKFVKKKFEEEDEKGKAEPGVNS
ncbi:MAG: hypothetical protein SPL72_05190 [Cyanobacteriota bacterium]|nr:hypothetical protein [Cyanobacteriota bacterium]